MITSVDFSNIYELRQVTRLEEEAGELFGEDAGTLEERNIGFAY